MRWAEEAYWVEYVIVLRRGLNFSQEAMASTLGTNQCTVSRWERGITVPNHRMREKLVGLRTTLLSGGVFTADAIAKIAQEILNASANFSMIVQSDGTILAVSPDSEYIPGSKLADQCLPEEMNEYHQFEAFLDSVDFWNTRNTCFKYIYHSRNEDCCAILTSIQIGTVSCCIVTAANLDGLRVFDIPASDMESNSH